MSINNDLIEAKKILMEYWPLNAFIATNPLWSLRNKDFFDVVSKPTINGLMPVDYYYQQYLENNITDSDIKAAIYELEKRSLSDDQLSQWVEQSLHSKSDVEAAILFSEKIDEYKFQKPMVWIKEHVFRLLRDYFGNAYFKKMHLNDFWHDNKYIECTELDNLRALSIEEAIHFLIKKLKVTNTGLVKYLENIYLNVYGWASLMNWRNQHPNNPWLPGNDPCEMILLIWLSHEYYIFMDMGFTDRDNEEQLSNKPSKKFFKSRYIWHVAFEKHYFNQLLHKINSNIKNEKTHCDAQFVFCIDTRSEGFRRHLESNDNVQTFGFAGFFGAIFKLNNDEKISYQAPALVEAVDMLTEEKSYSAIEKMLAQFRCAIKYTKQQLIAPFALFEMIGFWFLPYMIFKSIQPKLALNKHKNNTAINNSLSEETQFQAAYNLLTTIGLTNNFANHVFLCAHQSDTINNPYKSSLNCGACGGNSGIPNAVIMSDILNSQQIRTRLKKVHIVIPEDTKFIPACHHTVYDRLEILKGNVSLDILQRIDKAATALRKEKKNALPGHNCLSAREKNWSELIPELGLINNASMIIGPRALTRGQDLQRRAFLHSYDSLLDANGDVLASILSAPAVVAHWISSQYYFSTVNPNQFGAGNKAIHNVIPNIGVLEGNLSDLKTGLPLQSTYFRGEPIHEPRRIMVVVYATKQALSNAIEKAPNFKALLDNHWIYLKHIEAK